MAQIAFEGRLTADADIQYGQSGKARAKFTVAENHRAKNQQTGEYEDSGVTFHNVILFGRLAESPQLRKGTVVTVTGRQQSRAYEKDGEKRSWTETIADTIGIVPIPQRNPQPSGQGEQWNQQGAPAADPWSGPVF